MIPQFPPEFKALSPPRWNNAEFSSCFLPEIVLYYLSTCRCDGMVDVVDSKSTAGDSVPVRVRSPAPCKKPLLSARQKRFFTMISVPCGTGDIPCGYDICFADDIRFAYAGTDIISYGISRISYRVSDISLLCFLVGSSPHQNFTMASFFNEINPCGICEMPSGVEDLFHFTSEGYFTSHFVFSAA